MSAHVDVLAVIDRAIENLRDAGVIANTIGMQRARAAVAELIEAATRLEEISVCMNTAQSDRLTRLTAALARCKGGAL